MPKGKLLLSNTKGLRKHIKMKEGGSQMLNTGVDMAEVCAPPPREYPG